MKKNEIIELNGNEYTLELNRDSFIKIDKLCNISKSLEIINRNFYEYMDEVELSDDYNPLEDTSMQDINEDYLENEVKLKEATLHRLIERSMYLWLYPNHKLSITQVKELLEPYFEDEEKAEWLGNKVGQLLQECREVRETYVNEQKNLQALANKKN